MNNYGLAIFIVAILISINCASNLNQTKANLKKYNVKVLPSKQNSCEENENCYESHSDLFSKIINIKKDSIIIYYSYSFFDSTIILSRKTTIKDSIIEEEINKKINNIKSGSYVNNNATDCGKSKLYYNNKKIECECCKDKNVKSIESYLDTIADYNVWVEADRIFKKWISEKKK
jgi:hypothetical protein